MSGGPIGSLRKTQVRSWLRWKVEYGKSISPANLGGEVGRDACAAEERRKEITVIRAKVSGRDGTAENNLKSEAETWISKFERRSGSVPSIQKVRRLERQRSIRVIRG